MQTSIKCFPWTLSTEVPQGTDDKGLSDMAGKEKPVLVVGSINMDLVVRTGRLPAPGETILGKTFTKIPGGKGSNQAVAAARLGAKVSMVGCVGDDAYGGELLSGLRENQVDATRVAVCDRVNTGLAVITVDEGGANTIVVVSGANACLTPQVVEAALADFAEPGVLLLQQEIPPEVVDNAVLAAKRSGWLVMLNPAPAREVAGSTLACVDVLLPNETEAGIMTGLKIDTIDAAILAGTILLEKGVGAVVITLGKQGALYCSRAGLAELIPPLKVAAVDSTAAGDAFAGALACCLAEGKAIADSLRFATRVAALSVTRAGAQTSLPWRREVDELNP